MTTQETITKPMDVIADILRTHKAEIISQSDNTISFRGKRHVWGIAVECRERGYQLADLHQHWHFVDGKRGESEWLMVFNLPESAE